MAVTTNTHKITKYHGGSYGAVVETCQENCLDETKQANSAHQRYA